MLLSKQHDLSYSEKKTICSWSHDAPPAVHEISLDDPIYKPQRSVTDEQAILEQEFRELAETWRRQKGGTSSVMRKAMIPAYQQIIAKGPDIIPLILRELERAPDHWFWALEFLTGNNPVNDVDRGNIDKMTAAWVRWGKEQGHLL